jgi:aspartate kinase
MGEGLPFSMWRVDNRNAWVKTPKKHKAKRNIGDYFQENFWITTSGNFRTQALINTMLEVGSDRVLFSTDWPFENIDHACDWFDAATISEEDRRKIGRTNYDVTDQLANLGMEAIHPGAGRGLRQTDIPLRVRNTFDREDEGTLVTGDYVSDVPRVEIVTGIRQMQALQFFEQDMVGIKGYDSAILEVLARHGVWIVSKSSNANTITHYLSATPDAVTKVIADLQKDYPDAAISAQPVAMVSAIGSDISRPGLVPDALRALDEAGIMMIAMQHQIRNVDIQFIIECRDFDAAVRALHRALVEDEGQAAEGRRAA